jgi:hypothetical protein
MVFMDVLKLWLERMSDNIITLFMPEMFPVVLTAFLSVVSSLIALIAAHNSDKAAEKCNEVTNRTNREIAREEQEAENKRNDNQIEASIIWSTRVEWIQDVRVLTPEFISAVYNYIHSNKNERQNKLEIMREKRESLILCFDHDTDGVVDDNIDILDEHSNKDKNEKIVELIKKICSEAESYFDDLQHLEGAKNSLRMCEACKDSEEIFESCETIEYGQLPVDEQNRRCEERKNDNQKTIEEYEKKSEDVFEKINTLNEVMRIYFKIEWDRIKKRWECCAGREDRAH